LWKLPVRKIEQRRTMGGRALPLLLLVISALFAQIRASDPVIHLSCLLLLLSLIFWVRFLSR
jgi:hypothetical protein